MPYTTSCCLKRILCALHLQNRSMLRPRGSSTSYKGPCGINVDLPERAPRALHQLSQRLLATYMRALCTSARAVPCVLHLDGTSRPLLHQDAVQTRTPTSYIKLSKIDSALDSHVQTCFVRTTFSIASNAPLPPRKAKPFHLVPRPTSLSPGPPQQQTLSLQAPDPHLLARPAHHSHL